MSQTKRGEWQRIYPRSKILHRASPTVEVTPSSMHRKICRATMQAYRGIGLHTYVLKRDRRMRYVMGGQ